MALTTFRDTFRRITPGWLQGFIGERVGYALAIQLDLVADMCVEAVKRRFPGLEDTDDALGVIGRERRIRRGPQEPAATYAARLRRWRQDHRRRGGPHALLAQTGAYYVSDDGTWASGGVWDDEGTWDGAPFRLDLVYRSGRRFTRMPDGTITKSDINWSPGGFPPERWAHWWLFFAWPKAVDHDGTWASGGTWSDGGVWDSTLTEAEATSIRLVPAEWNAAHSNGTIVLLPGDLELWDFPVGLWSDPGEWGDELDTYVQLTVE